MPSPLVVVEKALIIKAPRWNNYPRSPTMTEK
jgi:hypothetical protein